MSLDISLTEMQPVDVFSTNITHNLIRMADAAGLYMAMWRPEEIGCVTAADIIPTLEIGIKDLKARPDYYAQFNPPNGFGDYDSFVHASEELLNACKANPTATLEVSR